jgi:hypothetical protein
MTVIDDDLWLINQASLLASRLEKLSADSIWARRSSGVRGNLLRELELATVKKEAALSAAQRSRLSSLVALGFDYLNKGAREKMVR